MSDTVNLFNLNALKFNIFKSLKFNCFKICFFPVVLICYNDEQIYSQILIYAFLYRSQNSRKLITHKNFQFYSSNNFISFHVILDSIFIQTQVSMFVRLYKNEFSQ